MLIVNTSINVNFYPLPRVNIYRGIDCSDDEEEEEEFSSLYITHGRLIFGHDNCVHDLIIGHAHT